jgi:hypothetical protein
MAKRPLKLTVRIPNFITDAMEWRRQINAAIAKKQAAGRVRYDKDDKLEVQVRFYLQGHRLTILDIDNRLKQVFDALQGFIGDKGKRHGLPSIIPNDNQIYRVVAEKRLPPKKEVDALGTIVIRGYDHHPSTARRPREYRKHVRPAG